MSNNHHNAEQVVKPELKILQDHLLANCLCTLPPAVSPTSVLSFSTVRTDVGVNQLLMEVTCFELICVKALKQSANPYRCRTLVDLRRELVRRQPEIVDYLLVLADEADQYVRYAAARALVIYFVMLRIHLERTWLRKLVHSLTHRASPFRMLFALDVLKRLIEWTFEKHVLEDYIPEDEIPAAGCHMLSMHAGCPDSSEVKCLYVGVLAPEWPRIVTQFEALIRDQTAAYRSCTLTFLSLWEAIISVKTNLSIDDTEPFYGPLDVFVSLLSSNVPPLVWKLILSLFNEALCYGSTLALQDDLTGEPCSVAHVIVRKVKDRRLLRTVPRISAGGGFSCSSSDGDKILLKKMVLLVLKAVAVTIKEVKYNSSDSSVGYEDEDRDMDIICRSIHDVLKKLEVFVKENKDFHPCTRLASWIVHLFKDQDDYLVESMVCCVDVASVLCYCYSNLLPELRKDLNPSETFLTFLNATSFNVDRMVDYLKSNKTDFLLYILNFLKYLRYQWGEFIETCKYELPAMGKVFSDLRSRIEGEVRINQITYDISPVVSLLKACEQRMFAGNSING